MQVPVPGGQKTGRCYLCSQPIVRGDKRISLPRLALVVHRACYEFDVTRGVGPDDGKASSDTAAA